MDQALNLRRIKKVDTMATLPRKPKVRVIAVTSGKGGVGKTNISANLAYSLAQKKKRALVFDADTGLANIDLLLGLTPKYNLYHVLAGEKRIEEILVQGPGGLMVLPSASGILEMVDLTSGQKMTLLTELNTLRDSLDYMLIDTAAGVTGNVMYFNAAAREIIVVVSPEPTSLTDAYALIKLLFRHHAKKRFRVLVNMVKTATEAKEVYSRLSEATDHFLNVSVEYLGYILWDDNLPKAVKKQVALMELYPQSPASRCIARLADKLCKEEIDDESDGNIEFFWEGILVPRDG